MQGLIGATLLYIGGLHQVFFFMFLLLTVLSIIPLGSGVVTLPIGVILLFTGQVWQGLVVIIGHLLIVTSIDNILRPHLVPKSVHLNSALTILSVFAGIAMFGFLGVVIGPVVMIMILTTIQLYVAVQQQKAPRGVEQSKLGEDIA
jgi:predicted PurR-regulated permease PerM